MRRTHILLLPAFLLLGVVACGGGGKGGSAPPGGSTHENGGRPVANGWDPFAPAQDPSPSGTDYPACTTGGTITVSQVIDAVLLPICNMAAVCGGTTQPTDPPPDAPSAANGGMSTRAGDVIIGSAPSYCEDIYKEINVDFEGDGFAGVCDLFAQISDALKTYPECNPPIVVPDGLCLVALNTCLNDIAALGCNPTASTVPRSCAGVSFGSTDSAGSGGSGGGGGGGSGGGGSGGGGGSTDPCTQCMTDCNGDVDCFSACYSSGLCG